MPGHCGFYNSSLPTLRGNQYNLTLPNQYLIYYKINELGDIFAQQAYFGIEQNKCYNLIKIPTD